MAEVRRHLPLEWVPGLNLVKRLTGFRGTTAPWLALPLQGVDWTRAFSHQGQTLTARERQIDPDYFAVMGIPLLAGRTFAPQDGGVGP